MSKLSNFNIPNDQNVQKISPYIKRKCNHRLDGTDTHSKSNIKRSNACKGLNKYTHYLYSRKNICAKSSAIADHLKAVKCPPEHGHGQGQFPHNKIPLRENNTQVILCSTIVLNDRFL